MRSLCLVVLTLCATSAEAQPTLARDRAPAVPAEIRQFVDRLYAANASVRAEAACQLRKQHRDATAAISVLLSMLADDITVPAIECHMSEWLRRQLPVSADARKWAETSPAKEAADTLGHIGDPAVPGLLQALNHTGWRVRKFAAYGLGEAEPQADRATAVAALGNRLATDVNVDVRERSAWALGEIEDVAAIDALTGALRGEGDRRVRAMAAWALGEIEHPSAVPDLVVVLGDSDLELRKKAAWALGEIESATAVDGLVNALKDPDADMRRQAAWALGEIEDRSAIPGLIGALTDAAVSVRKEAAWAMGEIEATSAVPALIDALKDTDWQVRRMAAWALGEIEDASALESLQAARYDVNVEVREAVVRAIRELRDR